MHTRISEQLSEDIRNLAEELRVPVSNLVRNVLEEAFSVVESVTGNVGELIEDVVEEAEAARIRLRKRRADAGATGPSDPARAPRTEFPEVLGWQPLVLNHAQSCADCGESIERGEQGYAGATAAGLTPIYLCADCVEARRG